jgi:hypothetical protein
MTGIRAMDGDPWAAPITLLSSGKISCTDMPRLAPQR